MFLEQQISILEWFLKGNVTLKTGVMMLKIQLYITEINYILQYKTVIWNCNNILLYFSLNKCSHSEQKRLLPKTLNLTDYKLLNRILVFILHWQVLNELEMICFTLHLCVLFIAVYACIDIHMKCSKLAAYFSLDGGRKLDIVWNTWLFMFGLKPSWPRQLSSTQSYYTFPKIWCSELDLI